MCALEDAACAQCYLNKSNSAGCNAIFERYSLHQACELCSDVVKTINTLVIITAVVGGLSIPAILAVFAVIFAYVCPLLPWPFEYVH
jgi:hypothetical protein